MFCKSYYSFVSGWFSYETILGVDMMYAIIGLALLQQLIHCMADYLCALPIKSLEQEHDNLNTTGS
jgi:hypothetical protein